MRLLLFNLATDANDPILGFTVAWIRALAKQVDQLSVVTMRAGVTGSLPANVSVVSLGKEKGYGRVRRFVRFYQVLKHVLDQGPIDACFSHMTPIFTVMAAPVLKVRAIPIVTWYAHPTRTPLLVAAHRLSDRMVTSLAEAYPYRPDKLVVIGQGIDTDLFRPDGIPPDHPPLVLCAGRLSPVKNHTTLLDAVALLRARHRMPLRVVILGDPATPRDSSYAATLRARAHDLDLGSLVHFEGSVPMTDLPRWYRKCSVHVNLTSTGFGDKVALEAMACARPSLVANRGFAGTLGQYADQLVFQCANPAHLAERLAGLLAMPRDERERMGSYLRSRVVHEHNLTGLVDRLIGVIVNLRRT